MIQFEGRYLKSEGFAEVAACGEERGKKKRSAGGHAGGLGVEDVDGGGQKQGEADKGEEDGGKRGPAAEDAGATGSGLRWGEERLVRPARRARGSSLASLRAERKRVRAERIRLMSTPVRSDSGEAWRVS